MNLSLTQEVNRRHNKLAHSHSNFSALLRWDRHEAEFQRLFPSRLDGGLSASFLDRHQICRNFDHFV